ANTVALYAARAAAADWDIHAAGVTGSGARALRVYESGETHAWIHKADDLSGFGTDAIRWIPWDSGQRMKVSELRAAIERDMAAGDRLMLVAGTAGTVITGAVDPL